MAGPSSWNALPVDLRSSSFGLDTFAKHLKHTEHIVFILYYADVIKIASKHGFKAHSYADDVQLYDHAEANSCATLVPRMSACVLEINEWMTRNRLKMNPAKTEIIWLGSARKLKHCPMDELSIAGVMLRPSTQVRDLGIQVDSNLSMSTHINHLTRACFYHIRQLRTVRRSLTVDTTHALVRAMVHSRLDYCNSVLAGQPKVLFRQTSIGASCFCSTCTTSTRLVECQCAHPSTTALAAIPGKSAVQAVHSCLQAPPSTGTSVLE